MGAEAATLSFMVGGDETTYLKCRPYFEAMGKQIYHVGSKIGSGLAVKLANNLMLVVNAGAALEAVALASKSGVDTPKLFEIVKSSTGDSYVVRHWDNLMNLFNTYPDINTRELIKTWNMLLTMPTELGYTSPWQSLLLRLSSPPHISKSVRE